MQILAKRANMSNMNTNMFANWNYTNRWTDG